MLETISKGFRAAKQRLSGIAELSEDVIDAALRDVRMSLLEADVDFKVTKSFLERVKEKALGEEVRLRAKSKEYGSVVITPEQAFIKICQDELTAMMGPVDTTSGGIGVNCRIFAAQRSARFSPDPMPRASAVRSVVVKRFDPTRWPLG